MHRCIYSQITIRDFFITKQPFFYDMICLTDVMCDKKRDISIEGMFEGHGYVLTVKGYRHNATNINIPLCLS